MGSIKEGAGPVHHRISALDQRVDPRGTALLEELMQKHTAVRSDFSAADKAQPLAAHQIVKVRVEHCTAPRPSIHLRGSSEKYSDCFQMLSVALTERLQGDGELTVTPNPEGPPRIGAFEVSFTLEDTRTRKQHGPFLVF